MLSPGPGNPKDFDLSRTIEIALRRKLPLIGVCLGLQVRYLLITPSYASRWSVPRPAGTPTVASLVIVDLPSKCRPTY